MNTHYSREQKVQSENFNWDMDNSQLMDKIGERIAYEKIVIQLYEKILTKHQHAPDKKDLPPYELLEQFYREEIDHYRLLSDVMGDLGRDPIDLTPSGNVENVAVNGWLKVMDDPDSTFEQCLHILHLAELGDNDSWEFLTELAELNDLKELAEKFRHCLAQEEGHLLNVRNWIRAQLLPDQSH